MSRILYLAAIVVFVDLFGRTASAGSDQTRFYKVTGRTIAELRASLDRMRPVGPGGRRFDGITQWDVRWRYGTGRSPAGCSVASFDVTLDIVMTLPRWIDESSAPAPVVARWRDYYSALLAHEGGHKAIGLEAAEAVRSVGALIPPQPSCGELRDGIKTAVADLLSEYRTIDREYDVETRHGHTQGAYLLDRGF